MYYLSVCAIFKDEGRYLREWINWHRCLGVEHFYLYNHNSTDNFRILQQEPIRSLVTINDIRKPAPQQVPAYVHAIHNYGKETEWLAIIDIDEFLLPLSKDTIPEVLFDFDNEVGVGINWALFGSSGHLQYPATGILRNFTRRALIENPINRHLKHIAKPRWVIGRTSAHAFTYVRKRFPVNMNYRKISNPGEKHDTCWERLRINHYSVRSKDEFVEKMKRGRANTAEPKLQRTWKFFNEHDTNEEEDLIAANLADKLHIEI